MKIRYKKTFLFNQEEVKNLREFLNNFNDLNHSIALPNISKYKILFDTIFSKRVFNFIDNNFKENVFLYYDFVIQKNNRNYLENTYYHKDSGKRNQSAIISKNKNLLFKVGIFLQDNIKEQGGGIDVLKPFYFDTLSDKNGFINKLRAVYYYLQNKFVNTQVYSKKGDAIIFNALVKHRTTATNLQYQEKLEDKYVIYFQLLNFDLIKDVLKIVDKDEKYKNEDDIKKNILTIENQGKTFRILNKEFTDLISSYLGSA
jgi:hypothetical protein